MYSTMCHLNWCLNRKRDHQARLGENNQLKKTYQVKRKQGRNEVCGIRDQKDGIQDHHPGTMGSESAFFIGIRDYAVAYLWDQGRNWVTLLESRIRNLRTKMGSAKKKHTPFTLCKKYAERMRSAIDWNHFKRASHTHLLGRVTLASRIKHKQRWYR